MHVHPEPLAQHLLRLRRVERAAVPRAEERETLDVVGGELGSEECVGLTGDDGKEGAGKDDENRRGRKAHQPARPYVRRRRALRQFLTSRAQRLRDLISSQPIGAGTQELARPAFLAGNDAAGRTRFEVTPDFSLLRGGKRAIGVLREKITNAATGRFHRRPPATSAGTDAAGDSFSYSMRRPREMRDITVPIGTFNISAISA